MKNTENKVENNMQNLHVALINESIITTESIKLALKRFNHEKMGIHICQVEEQPFLRYLMMYINKYKIDLLIIDADLNRQNVSLYLQKIKNFDKNIKIIALAKIITKELIEMNQKGYVDEYITLPFQDANLWSAIIKIYTKTQFKKVPNPINLSEVENITSEPNQTSSKVNVFEYMKKQQHVKSSINPNVAVPEDDDDEFVLDIPNEIIRHPLGPNNDYSQKDDSLLIDEEDDNQIFSLEDDDVFSLSDDETNVDSNEIETEIMDDFMASDND